MGQKLIVPVAVLVLAIAGGVAIYLLLQDDPPQPEPVTDSVPRPKPAPGGEPLNKTDFELARIKPDPVRNERPAQPYKAPKETHRIVLSGRVVDEHGSGVADARVQFVGASQLSSMKGHGYTDAGGNYSLLAWAPSIGNRGDRLGRVAATSPDGRVAVGDNETIPDTASADLRDLVLDAVARLEGRVVTKAGEPAPGAAVTMRSAGPVQVSTLQGREANKSRRQYVVTVVADQTGTFKAPNLPPGRYQLSAEAGYFGVSGGKPEVDLTTVPYAWQDVQLDATNHVRGVLKDASGNPIPSAVVKLSPVQALPALIKPPEGGGTIEALNNRRDSITSFRNDGTETNVFGDRRALTDAAGRFGFAGLSDMEYKLAAKLGEAESRTDGVRVNQPDYELQLEVKLSVAGVVRDAETRLPLEFFDARMAQAGGEPVDTPFSRVADDGRFDYHPGGGYMIVNPAPGMVRISAPGFLPATVDVSDLREGDTRRDLDAELKPLCELSFELTRDGRRLDFEPVALLFDERLAYEASSDQVGRVRIPRVAPGSYLVKVTLADGTALSGELLVPAKRLAELEVKLK